MAGDLFSGTPYFMLPFQLSHVSIKGHLRGGGTSVALDVKGGAGAGGGGYSFHAYPLS